MEPNNEKIDDENVLVTIRSLFSNGNEISSIIGRQGCILRRLRQESGAKISITDASSPDRIVTVSGTVDQVCTAYHYMCKCLSDYLTSTGGPSTNRQGKNSFQQILLKLIIPATHCGSIIGKSGSKIKEIRELSGGNIQVAAEMLPLSTERIVTVTGMENTVTQAIYQICMVLIDCTMVSVKGAVIPFEPKSATPAPVILSGGQAYTLHGEYAVPVQEVGGKKQPHPLAGLATLGLEGGTAALTPAALLALSGTQQKRENTSDAETVEHDIVVSNEIAGCVVGKDGSRLFEIKQISGAQIIILSSNVDPDEKLIRVKGSQEAASLAQYLVNMCIELQKTNIDSADNPSPAELDKAITAFMCASNNANFMEYRSANNLDKIAMGNLTELLANIANSTNKVQVTTTGAVRRNQEKDN